MDDYLRLSDTEIQQEDAKPKQRTHKLKAAALGGILALVLVVLVGTYEYMSQGPQISKAEAQSSLRTFESNHTEAAGECASYKPIPGSNRWYTPCPLHKDTSTGDDGFCYCYTGHTADKFGNCQLCYCQSETPILRTKTWDHCEQHPYTYRCGEYCCCEKGYSENFDGMCAPCLGLNPPAPTPTPAPVPAPVHVTPPIPAPACYSGSATAMFLTEYVSAKVLDYSHGHGHVNIIGSGVSGFKCLAKPFTKDGDAIDTDLSDCQPSGASIQELKYNSRTDRIVATVSINSPPITQTAEMSRSPCS